MFVAFHGSSEDGFASLDSFKFDISEGISCPIRPAIANPNPCTAGQFECVSDNACINRDQICDFWNDCIDDSDEKFCPKDFTFENCASEEEPLCYWHEEPHDQLDWVMAQSNDSLTSSHGPFVGGGHFLYLHGKLGADGDYSGEQGRVLSPTYTQSASECYLYIYYYINGDTGDLESGDGKAALSKNLEIPTFITNPQTPQFKRRILPRINSRGCQRFLKGSKVS